MAKSNLFLFAVLLFAFFNTFQPSVIADEQEKAQEQEKVYELPEVTVVGKEESYFTTLPPRDLIKRPITESPGLETATSVIGRKEIQQLKAYSIVDAMKYVPGAWTESRGRKVKQFFSVRGQRYPYPGYTIDGAWFREFHETNYFLSAANVERIEIVRSSSAMLLGPGAMTGMINIIPRDYTEQETQIDTIFGSDNTYRTYLSHGNAGKDYSYALGAGYRHTDGHWHNSRENMSNIFGRLSFKPTSELTLSLNSFVIFGDRELRLAEPPATSTLQTRRESFDPMTTFIFVGKARYEPSDRASTDVTVNYANRRFHGHRQASPPSWTEKPWSASDWLEHDYEYGINVIQSLRLSERNVLRLGGMFNRWESPTGKRFYVGRPGDLWTYSGVVVDEHDFGRLDLNLGYRVSRTYFDRFGGFNVEGSAAGLTSVLVDDEWEDPLHTITLGASYELTDELTLFGNYTWGQIAAAPGMLNAELQRPGIETRSKLDIGIKKKIERFGEVALTGFYVYQDDAALLSSQKVIVNGVDFGLYENGDRDNFGLELDIRSVRFENGLQFFFNATAMQTRRTKNGGWGKDREIPEIVLGGGAFYGFGDFELAVFANHVSDYENERFLPSPNPSAPLGDFTELNAQITYHFGKKKDRSVFFRVDNIGDKHYSTVNGYPDQGRRFMTGMSIKF